jgi:3-hydroxyisobutyrate dehydrogenase
MTEEAGAMRIGFIGLGVMGAPMASHLHRAGHTLALFDLNLDVSQHLAQSLGGAAKAVKSLKQLAEKSDVVITMLPNGSVVQQVVLGENGLASAMAPGSLLLDTSSSEPWLTRQTAEKLRAQGVSMVDAPVSGAQWGAQEANLVFMAGGAKADIDRVRPLLDHMGRAVFHLGLVGSGHAMKCINNLITAITFSATAEGLVIGKSSGLDPAAMLEVMNLSTSMSWITQNHIQQRILSRSFDDPFKLELMLKDIGIAATLARENGNAVPLTGLAQQLWQAADIAAGKGASVSELVRWVEQQSGVAITPGSGLPPQGKPESKSAKSVKTAKSDTTVKSSKSTRGKKA